MRTNTLEDIELLRIRKRLKKRGQLPNKAVEREIAKRGLEVFDCKNCGPRVPCFAYPLPNGYVRRFCRACMVTRNASYRARKRGEKDGTA